MHNPDWRADVRARLAPNDDADIVEEVAQHLELQFADLAPRIGADAARERLLAQLRDQEFDATVAGKKRGRPSRARVWSSSSLLRDVRYGFRALARSPSTLAAGTAALALGIGLSVAMFSVIYGLLIKGLPFDDPSRIALVKYIDPRQPGVDALVPFAEFAQYRTAQHPFETFAAYSPVTVNVSGGDRPDRIVGARVTPGVLETTRTQPLLGRMLSAADTAAGAAPAAVISHAVWRDRFAADAAIVGRSIRVDGRPHTIVGVMPPEFVFPENARIWLPLVQSEKATVIVVGRLRQGETYDAANAEFAGLGKRMDALRPPTDTNMRLVVLPFVRGSINPRFFTLMGAMLVAVLLVLLVACANVANLLLDRAANRTREIGIRTALGASRLAIVRQSLVESAILATLAAMLGVGVAQAGIIAFNRAVAQSPTPLFWMDVRLHPAVLVFVAVLAIAASLVSGLLPALQSARLDINAILKDESHAASSMRIGRLSRAIVVAEIAISAAILLASGFITRSIVNLRDVRPGFRTERIVTARVTLSTPDTVRQRAVLTEVERGLSRLSGGNVFVGNGLPGTGWTPHHAALEGRTYARPNDMPVVRTLAVSPGFFPTFGVPVLRGRAITQGDRAGTERVAVVSESFVRRLLPKADPIGARIRLSSDSTAPWVTIVGVMPTLFSASFDDPWPSEVLTSFWQERRMGSATIAIGGDANATDIRRVVAPIDPEMPVYATQSMSEVMRQATWFFHVFATMFVVFGVVALVLSSIGLYAVMTFSVSRRVREMGIRLALGASGGDVLRMVFRQGMRQIMIGMAIGFLAGAGIVQVVRAALFGVRPGDPMVMGLVAAVIAGTAALACIVPARRATRVDPVIALRSE